MTEGGRWDALRHHLNLGTFHQSRGTIEQYFRRANELLEDAIPKDAVPGPVVESKAAYVDPPAVYLEVRLTREQIDAILGIVRGHTT